MRQDRRSIRLRCSERATQEVRIAFRAEGRTVGLVTAGRPEKTFLRCASVDYSLARTPPRSGTTGERDYGDIHLKTGYGRGPCGGVLWRHRRRAASVGPNRLAE